MAIKTIYELEVGDVITSRRQRGTGKFTRAKSAGRITYLEPVFYNKTFRLKMRLAFIKAKETDPTFKDFYLLETGEFRVK